MAHAHFTRTLPVMAFLLIIASMFVIPSLAATQQWFPTESTSVVYDIKHVVTAKNGTVYESDTFNVYNLSSFYYVAPVGMKETIPSNWELVAGNTKVTMKHAYTPNNATHLYRSTTMTYGNTTAPASSYFNMVYYHTNLTYAFFQRSTAANYPVPRNQFETSFPSGDFMDCINCELGPSEKVITNFYVLSVTDDQIIAGYSTSNSNYTIIAGRDGKITDFSLANSFGMDLATYMSSEYLFYIPSGPSIDGVPVPVLFGVAVITVGTIVVLSRKKLAKL
nr:hypothetical protein [Candidatus Sigynarchaeota archaeon]